MTPVWEIALQQRWQHATRCFELQWSYATSAKRLVLVGSSGAGKSQSLRLIAGLQQAQQGYARLQGQTLFDVAQHRHLAPEQRKLGLLFQDYALFPHLTVSQNIGFGLQTGWRNPPRHTDSPQVLHWLQAFGLREVAQQYPWQLSGGQKQRVALARTLVAAPRALLLDEPFAALDSSTRANLRDLLADLLDDSGLPMIMISHDDEDVARFGQAVVRLEDGRLID